MNRLLNESSPYLLQHAENPVDWYPWANEAFNKAKNENKPIFLSIGYSTCHWCHVMAHESFENPQVANLLNDSFISIKLDREERPDIDDIYMKAVLQLNNGQGGWPMSIFLTPDLKPFYGGTYYQTNSFIYLLSNISRLWGQNNDKISSSANDLTRAIKESLETTTQDAPVDRHILKSAGEQIKERYDEQHGGFSTAPKFPMPTTLSMLLDYSHVYNDTLALKMLTTTADKMAMGGIFDQIGGGFHRYSTDKRWLVPHFEKMLYDNAQLITFYSNLYRKTKDKFHLNTAVNTSEYLTREMRSTEGGYYSAQDADSDGIEGKFYCWTKHEIESILPKHEVEIFNKYFDLEDEPNFVFHHGTTAFESNVLSLKNKIEAGDIATVESAKKRLLSARNSRSKPHRDEKILTSWNALLISAMTDLYKATLNTKYLDEAETIANFVLLTMFKDNKLFHSCVKGKIKSTGLLEDYSYLAKSLISLYEISFNINYINQASLIAELMIDIFYDNKNSGFFDYDPANPEYIYIAKDPYDGVTPSSNGTAIAVLQKLAVITNTEKFCNTISKSIQYFSANIQRFPSAYPTLIQRVTEQTENSLNVQISSNHPQNSSLVEACYHDYLPFITISASDKPVINNSDAAYVCKNKTCLPPIFDPKDLKNALGGS